MNMKTRYSIRKYKPEPVDNELIRQIVDDMLLSPSGKNKKPWEFLVIDDAKIIHGLSKSKKAGAGFVKYTSNVVMVLSLEDESDTWIEDGAITLMVGHLKAHELGLGSCWIQIRNREAENMDSESFVREYLDLPDCYRIVGFLTIGYPDEKITREKNANYLKVHHNRLGAKYE